MNHIPTEKQILMCEICHAIENVKISRRYISNKFGCVETLDRPLCKDCIKFTEAYLRTISEKIDD